MKPLPLLRSLALCLPACACLCLPAQSTTNDKPDEKPQSPKTPQMPHRSLRGLTVPDVPEHLEPLARDFVDPKYKVSFHIPAGWNFEKKDGVLSSFRAEATSASARSDVRAVAAINFNPWPPTTFAGAAFYYSVLPSATAAVCAVQTSGRTMKTLPDTQIGSLAFHHARDQRGKICTEARSEIFTAKHGAACLRFDLVVNTFCSDTSGAMTITPDQLKDVETRLGGILDSVRIDGR